ncbi:MAG: CDP-alcohol phosphatidyltransferase family protein [Acidimicrobiales bacterium]
MFDSRWRSGVDNKTAPMGAALGRLGISADQLTITGLVMSGVTAALLVTGHLFGALLALVASALPDLLDGPVAKASGTASARGAFFDSVSDRVSDALVLGGLAWFLAVGHAGRGGRGAVLVLAVLGVSTLVSYERAKAESLGFVARGGVMERAERVIALCIGLAFPVLLIPMLWVMLVLTSGTALNRFYRVWTQASLTGPDMAPSGDGAASVEPTVVATVQDLPPVARPVVPAWRVGRVESRWRDWRQASLARADKPARTESSLYRWRARRQGAMSSRPTRSATRSVRTGAGTDQARFVRSRRVAWTGLSERLDRAERSERRARRHSRPSD